MARAIDIVQVKREIQTGKLEVEFKDGDVLLTDKQSGEAVCIATLTPPNEPLTIEQLREMGGQPVYMPETNCWALVTQSVFCPILTFPDGEKCSVYDWYEQVGPVYRRPPEGEA